MFSEKRKFKNSQGFLLSAIYEGKDKKAPVVIICHGYASSKASESQADLSKRLKDAGFSVYRFDFTGCGESQGTVKDRTPEQGLDDLISAVKDLSKKEFLLYGSSYGGYVALRYAEETPPKALVLKAPVSDWLSVKSTDQDLIQMIKFLAKSVRVNIYKKAKNITCPVLIAHGDADETVPIEQSKHLLKNLGSKRKTLKIIKGAPHIMRGVYMQQVHQLIADFFKNELTSSV